MPGTCVAKRWWYQEVLDLTIVRAAAAIEEEGGGIDRGRSRGIFREIIHVIT